jgi:hypothetical protein
MPLADGGQQHLSRTSSIPLFGKPVAIALKVYKYHFTAKLSTLTFICRLTTCVESSSKKWLDSP